MSTKEALEASRFTAGHPDGYGLAFANLYRDFAQALLLEATGGDPAPHLSRLPGMEDGIHTLQVVEAAMRSHTTGQQQMQVPSRASNT